jgi:hypothetical protein
MINPLLFLIRGRRLRTLPEGRHAYIQCPDFGLAEWDYGKKEKVRRAPIGLQKSSGPGVTAHILKLFLK